MALSASGQIYNVVFRAKGAKTWGKALAEGFGQLAEGIGQMAEDIGQSFTLTDNNTLPFASPKASKGEC